MLAMLQVTNFNLGFFLWGVKSCHCIVKGLALPHNPDFQLHPPSPPPKKKKKKGFSKHCGNDENAGQHNFVPFPSVLNLPKSAFLI